MNIEDIQNATKDTEPCFFSESNMRFWGQTLNDFTVTLCDDGRYKIVAPICTTATIYGYRCPFTETIRFYNPLTNRLDMK
jgi:hypothetical protein